MLVNMSVHSFHPYCEETSRHELIRAEEHLKHVERRDCLVRLNLLTPPPSLSVIGLLEVVSTV